jgi:hypothetical protein
MNEFERRHPSTVAFTEEQDLIVDDEKLRVIRSFAKQRVCFLRQHFVGDGRKRRMLIQQSRANATVH